MTSPARDSVVGENISFEDTHVEFTSRDVIAIEVL